MKVPSDPVEAAIFGIDVALEALNALDSYNQVANGIVAKAEAEGRDVNEDEQKLINAMLDEAVAARKGQAGGTGG